MATGDYNRTQHGKNKHNTTFQNNHINHLPEKLIITGVTFGFI